MCLSGGLGSAARRLRATLRPFSHVLPVNAHYWPVIPYFLAHRVRNRLFQKLHEGPRAVEFENKRGE